jgi:RecA-family ATPase
VSESIEEWEKRQRSVLAAHFIGAGAMLRAAKDTPDFLVKNMIPAGGITLVVGKPGTTKSWLVYDLALATMHSRPWLGTKPTTGPVVVLSYDNPTPETGRRFKRLGLREGDPIMFHSPTWEALKLPDAADDLVAVVHAVEPKLVIVDSFRQAVNGNENDSEAMGEVMGSFKKMAASPSQPAVVVIHHAGKGILLEGSGARGSGEMEGSADAVISIEDGKATWTKTRSWQGEKQEYTYALNDVGASTQLKVTNAKLTSANKAA